MRPRECGFYTGFMKHTKAFLKGLQIYLFWCVEKCNKNSCLEWSIKSHGYCKNPKGFVNKITFQKWKIFRICRSILDKYSEKEICSCKKILTWCKVTDNPILTLRKMYYGTVYSLWILSIYLSEFYLSEFYLSLYLNSIYLSNQLTTWSRVLPKKLTSPQLVKEFPALYGTWKINFCIHKHLPPVPFLNQSNPVHASTFHFLRIHYNIILPSMARSSKLLLLWVCLTRTLYTPLLFPIHTTYPVHLILLDLITWLIFGKEYGS